MLKRLKNTRTQGKTYNKSSRRINHKAPKSKTNTGFHRLRTVSRVNHRGWGWGRGKAFTASQLHPGSRCHSQSQLVKQKAKWAAVEGDQNASITTQLVKQKAKWAAVEDGDHNASIKTHTEKTVQRVKPTTGPPPKNGQ